MLPERNILQNILGDLVESPHLLKHIYNASKKPTNAAKSRFNEVYKDQKLPPELTNELFSNKKDSILDEIRAQFKPHDFDVSEQNKDIWGKLRSAARGSAYTYPVVAHAGYYGFQYLKNRNNQPQLQDKEAMTKEFTDGFIKRASEHGFSKEEAEKILNKTDRTPIASNLLASMPGIGLLSSATRAMSRKSVLNNLKNEKEKELWLKTHPYGHPGLSKLIGGIAGDTLGAIGTGLMHSPGNDIGRLAVNLGGLAGRLGGYNYDENNRLAKIKELVEAEKAKY